MNQIDIAYPLQIVRCAPEQAAQVVELLYCLYLELDEGNEKQAAFFLTEELIYKVLDEGKTIIVGAQEHDKIVGIMTITESTAFYAGGNYGSIDELYIKPEYRCRNIGKHLIEEVKKIAETKKWQRVVVNAPRDNNKWKGTIRFYERNGFEMMGNMLKFTL